MSAAQDRSSKLAPVFGGTGRRPKGAPVTPLDALWHVTNLLAPLGVSVLLALLLRVVWRAQRMDLRKMVLWGGLGGAGGHRAGAAAAGGGTARWRGAC